MARFNKLNVNHLNVRGNFNGGGAAAAGLLRPTGVGPNEGSSHVYYVDRNAGTTGNGTSWDKAFLTITEAITAVNADYNATVGAGTYPGGGRNRTIMIAEGWYSEVPDTLTASDVTIMSVASGSRIADGTVFYGSATAGGFDAGSGAAGLTVTGSAVSFVNMGFMNSASGLFPCISVGSSGSSGPNDVAFYNCFFPRDVADAYTYAIASYANEGTFISGCRFSQSAATGGVLIASNGVTNPVNDRIIGSTFVGTPTGINQTAGHNTLVTDNEFMDSTDDRADTCDNPIVCAATSMYTTRNISYNTNRADLCTGAAFTGGTALDLNNFGSDDTNT
jgi:hypothetical protein